MALRRPGHYRSVSAFAPVVNPTQCPWGRKAFSAYLGEDVSRWTQYDACELVARGASRQPLFIDQARPMTSWTNSFAPRGWRRYAPNMIIR